MKVLLVDDNELDRARTRQALMHMNQKSFEITECQTASEGLSKLQDHAYEIILLDLHLPDSDGVALVSDYVAMADHQSAVVVITGAGENHRLEEECLEAGAQDVLFKNDITPKIIHRAIFHAKTRYKLECQLHESNRKLRLLAECDSLTGLSNRYLFDANLRSAILRARRHEETLALFFIDLDNFKAVNDTLGHQKGDELLKTIANKLMHIVREGDTICRLGGDEFAILAYNFESRDYIVKMANRILEEIRNTYFLDGTEFPISCSIGIALYPESGAEATDMLKAADLAMYQAKSIGKNNFHFYSESLQRLVQDRLRLEKELRALIPTDHFILYYQPIVDAKDYNIVAAESLVRWDHPTRGILPPSEFIGLAEETGLITEIDSKTRLRACQHLSGWIKSQLVASDFIVHFNVCAQLLKDREFLKEIKKDIRLTEIKPENLSLEITESVIIDNLENASELLNQICEFGMDVSVDDFGTGYSSLAYLKALPAKTLKIDREFIKGVPQNEDDVRILKALIVFAKSLDLKVIIEGVETMEQANLCSAFGADLLQGYYFSKPVSKADFEQLLIKTATGNGKHTLLNNLIA